MHSRKSCDVARPGRGRSIRTGVVLAGIFVGCVCRASDPGDWRPADGNGWFGGVVLLAAMVSVVAWRCERRKRRKIAAQLLSASERLRVLFDESPLSICLFDPHDREVPFRVVECNQYACDLHGLTRDELIGKGMGVLTPMDITFEDAQSFVELLRKGAVRGENPHRKKDGTVFYIEYVTRLVTIDGREYMIGADRDLTAERARRASEEQLRETAEFNQLVLRASNDGVWDWHVEQKNIRYSDRCREMLGYGPDELPDGDPYWIEMIHPEDQKPREDVLRRHWDEGAPYVFQFRARHKDGNWRWLISRGITLFDAEHRPMRMVGCRTDITELKRIDAELLQSRKLRAVGEMVGGIAHEFNNLLTPMLLHAEMLGMGREHDRHVGAHLGPIRIGIDRARELTQRILTFGRRSTDGRELLDLDEVVRDNLAFLAQTIERRIVIDVAPSSAGARVWANRSDLNQLIVNLVLNARDTLQEKEKMLAPTGWSPRVEVSIAAVTRASGARDVGDRHTPRQWHCLVVSDNGLGMSDEVRERVFEPFFTTKEVGRGTGLGLATAWHVATALGGWIDIESKVGEGTAFRVFLPAASGDSPPNVVDLAPLRDTPDSLASKATAAVVEVAPAKSAGEVASRRRVLLVEDNDIVRFATEQLIASFGNEVECVADGRSAWDRLREQPGRYDMVFSDLNIPGFNGVELVRELRASGYPGKIVVYSGYFSSADQAQLELMKVDHLLPKPFMRAQLAPILA